MRIKNSLTAALLSFSLLTGGCANNKDSNRGKVYDPKSPPQTPTMYWIDDKPHISVRDNYAMGMKGHAIINGSRSNLLHNTENSYITTFALEKNAERDFLLGHNIYVKIFDMDLNSAENRFHISRNHRPFPHILVRAK